MEVLDRKASCLLQGGLLVHIQPRPCPRLGPVCWSPAATSVSVPRLVSVHPVLLAGSNSQSQAGGTGPSLRRPGLPPRARAPDPTPALIPFPLAQGSRGSAR